jgi:NDP-sugar pyrophosphorylase family protein
MFSVAILAGGLATRLRPITETIPKALVEVAGKPFIVRQLDYLRDQGITQVVLCVGYLGEMIRDLVGDGYDLGLHIRYSEDGARLLGTGGALKKAVPLLGDNFFVLYGDSFLPISFYEVQSAYVNSEQKALMTVLKNQNQWDTSNVLFARDQLIEYNKRTPRPNMNYIDYGLGIFSSAVFDPFPAEQPLDLADIYQGLSVQGQLAGFEVCDRFYEIGSPSGLKETEEYFLIKDRV